MRRRAIRSVRLSLVAIAVTGVGAMMLFHLLHGSRVSLYAGPGAEADIRKASEGDRSCVHPTTVPMNVNNAQNGVARGSYYMTNDTWNAHGYAGLSQTIYVCNYNDWYAIATMNNVNGDGAVKTSPNVQETWYPAAPLLASWESITSDFSDVPPGAGPKYGIWEFEYDIWLNGFADSKSTEVMIWTYNNGQTPTGSPSGSFSDAGQTYDVFRRSPPDQYVAFVDRSYRLSGHINLLDFLSYVVSRHWMPKSSALYQICNGVELVSTNGKPEKFAVDNFSVKMKAIRKRR